MNREFRVFRTKHNNHEKHQNSKIFRKRFSKGAKVHVFFFSETGVICDIRFEIARIGFYMFLKGAGGDETR